jgi:hypothetical protein
LEAFLVTSDWEAVALAVPERVTMSESPKNRVSAMLSHEDLQALVLQLEKMDVQINALAKRLVAVERRQETFAMFFRQMLELYDRNAARLHLLDGRSGKESVDEILKAKPARTMRHKQQQRRQKPKTAPVETAGQR